MALAAAAAATAATAATALAALAVAVLVVHMGGELLLGGEARYMLDHEKHITAQ